MSKIILKIVSIFFYAIGFLGFASIIYSAIDGKNEKLVLVLKMFLHFNTIIENPLALNMLAVVAGQFLIPFCCILLGKKLWVKSSEIQIN